MHLWQIKYVPVDKPGTISLVLKVTPGFQINPHIYEIGKVPETILVLILPSLKPLHEGLSEVILKVKGATTGTVT